MIMDTHRKTPTGIAILTTALLVVTTATAQAAYLRKQTWQETMLHYQQSLRTDTDGQVVTLAQTGVIKGSQKSHSLSVDVSGLDELWLHVTIGPDTYSWDQSLWGDPVLIDEHGNKTDLTTLKPISVKIRHNTFQASPSGLPSGIPSPLLSV